MADTNNSTAKQHVVGQSLADEVATVLARALAELRVRRQVLAAELGAIDDQVTAIRDNAYKQLKQFAAQLKAPPPAPASARKAARPARKAAELRLVTRRAQPTPARKGPAITAATRRRMSRAAKRRWRAARKQDPNVTRLTAKA